MTKKKLMTCSICLETIRRPVHLNLNCDCRYNVHYNCYMSWWRENKNCIIIDPANSNPLETATLIASCNFIISSSLHGLIAADSLNIPHVWMKISNKIIGGNWKFNDYFLSMNKEQVEPLIIKNLSAKSWVNNIQISERKILETKINELLSIDLSQI